MGLLAGQARDGEALNTYLGSRGMIIFVPFPLIETVRFRKLEKYQASAKPNSSKQSAEHQLVG